MRETKRIFFSEFTIFVLCMVSTIFSYLLQSFRTVYDDLLFQCPKNWLILKRNYDLFCKYSLFYNSGGTGADILKFGVHAPLKKRALYSRAF